jgi:hypothetical protein
MNSITGNYFEKFRKCSYVKRNGTPCDKCVSIKDVDNDWKFCSIHRDGTPTERKLKKIIQIRERQEEDKRLQREAEDEKIEIQRLYEEKVQQRVEERILDYTTKMEEMEKITTKYNALQEKFKTLKSLLAEVGVDLSD